IIPNSEEGRLRLRIGHDQYGDLGFGTNRALFQDSEVGRYQRSLFGPFLGLKSPEVGPGHLELHGFFAPAQVDPLRNLSSFPAHEEFRATGGSLFYLGNGGVTKGSEIIRIEYRDGNTALPLGEEHLSRSVDYEIDYVSGRILLARPLSFSV